MSIHPGMLGKYELRERLGQGGMAEVWKAYDQRLQRFVAIKFLHTMLQADPTFLSRFEREARAVASLRHPNIVQIYDFETAAPDRDQPFAYMVMDYIEGSTLADYLYSNAQAHKFLTPQEIVALFSSISGAIDYAHQQGLLHRDIKPANILLDKRRTERNAMGEPILTDFGIVKMLGSAAGTLTSSAMGTPLYVAPEQALGQTLDAAGDIYSLGVILYEICTGLPPFNADTPVAIVQQHISLPPTPPERVNAAISPALSAVILRGLAKKPVDRFPSAQALTAAVAEALNVPLPERLKQTVSAPDIRDLPAPTVASPISPVPELAALASDQPTEISGRAHAPTLRAGQSVPPALPVSPIPPTLIDARGGFGPTAPGTLSMRVPSAPLKPLHEATPPPQRPLARPRWRRGLFVLLILCVLVAGLGGGLTLFLRARNAPSTVTTPRIMGSAFFTSSGAGNGANNMGINDLFQVRLTNVPAPAAGNQYYAWLLPDQIQSESSPRALGALVVSAGIATLSRPYMDPRHENLVGLFSRFLVTEEPMNPAPQSPSLNEALWRYYGAIPQASPIANCQGGVNQLDVLCHLRHLLSGDPELAQVQLHGGLNYWFLNNVKEMQKWATEAVDHNNPVDIRHKVANILYLLDGRACVAHDLLNGAPGADNTPDDTNITTLAAVSLLDCAQTPDVPGYLSHIHSHLNAMIQSPGVQSNQITLGNQIGTELNIINEWLMGVQKDAHQLLAMDDTRLVQASGQSKRSEMETLATNVLSGGTNPTTGTLEKGVASISDQIQQLATMYVMVYSRSH